MATRKLTPAEKAEKKKRQSEYMTIFINGKQKRVRRLQTIDGLDSDEFIRMNSDPIWLHQNEMWEYLITETAEETHQTAEDTGEHTIHFENRCRNENV